MGLKISLSSNPRLEFNEIYHFGPLQTFPDWKFHFSKNLTFSKNFHPIQDFNQICHFGPRQTLFPNISQSFPDFDRNCHFGPLRTYPERKFHLKKKMPDPRFYLKLLFLVKCGHVQTVNFTLSKDFCLILDFCKCHFGPRFCTKLSFYPQQNVKTKNFTFSNNFHPIQDFNQTCHFGPPLTLFSHIFHLIPDFGQISYNFGTLGYSRN